MKVLTSFQRMRNEIRVMAAQLMPENVCTHGPGYDTTDNGDGYGGAADSGSPNIQTGDGDLYTYGIDGDSFGAPSGDGEGY